MQERKNKSPPPRFLHDTLKNADLLSCARVTCVHIPCARAACAVRRPGRRAAAWISKANTTANDCSKSLSYFSASSGSSSATCSRTSGSRFFSSPQVAASQQWCVMAKDRRAPVPCQLLVAPSHACFFRPRRSACPTGHGGIDTLWSGLSRSRRRSPRRR